MVSLSQTSLLLSAVVLSSLVSAIVFFSLVTLYEVNSVNTGGLLTPESHYVTSNVSSDVLSTSQRGALKVTEMNSELSTGGHTPPSYQCTASEKKFQFDNTDFMHASICDTLTVWRLAQLSLPDATTFIDVGGNRGYISATMFALWSPGDNFNPIALKKAITNDLEKKITNNTDNIDTVCGSGMTPVTPIICQGRDMTKSKSARCSFRRPIQVYAFDGQRGHVEDQRGTVYRHFPHLSPSTPPSIGDMKSTWEFTHAAVTDVVKPGENYGYFTTVTHEGGKLIKGVKQGEVPSGAELVPLTTVDKFCSLRKLDRVDIIKIDAEGSDLSVIRGSFDTLKNRGVKMITYEYSNSQADEFSKMIHTLDTEFGFDCFHGTEKDILIRVTNCWDPVAAAATSPEKTPCMTNCPVLHHKPNNRLGGNGYCVHRLRAHALWSLLDDMSLHKYADKKRGDIHKDALLGQHWATFEKDDSGNLAIRNSDFARSEKSSFLRNYGRDHDKDPSLTPWLRRRLSLRGSYPI